MAQSDLSKAKKAKNDEFYTQYIDIEKEINAYLEYNEDVFRGKTILLPCDDPEWSNFTKYFAQNFENFGLKKLISTSYAVESKLYKGGYQVTMFEESAPQYDSKKTRIKGKIFTLDHDTTGDGKIDVEDLEWKYLEGDGDFRSYEIKKLRDESDIIITNPPFSLFREFLGWLVEADKKFVIIGNMNAITYKEVFPLIQGNKMWTGSRFNQRVNGKNMTFYVPDDYDLSGTEVEKDEDGNKMISVAGTGWYTNLDHGRRHQPLKLMTMAENLRYNKKMQGKDSYESYDNYNAIEVPFTECIPSDYDGIMGVPISFLNKHNPDQFEIIWQASGNTRASAPKDILKRLKYTPHRDDRGGCTVVNGKRTYGRILIKHRNPKK
jgi:hypothetical protein